MNRRLKAISAAFVRVSYFHGCENMKDEFCDLVYSVGEKMKFEARIEEDVVLFQLGEKYVNGAETENLSEQFQDFTSKGYDKFVIDFEGVHWINSPGVGVLIKWLKILRENGGDMVFVNTGRKIKRYLEITKLITIIQTFDSSQDAVKSFPRSRREGSGKILKKETANLERITIR